MARLGGSLGFAGSEFVKVLAAMFIAGYVARPSGLSPSTLPGYLLPLGLTLLLSVLLLAQPDFGAVIVMMSGGNGGVVFRQDTHEIFFAHRTSWRWCRCLAHLFSPTEWPD